MNTIKGVATASARSPSAIASVVCGGALCWGALSAVARSEALWDDAAVVATAALAATVVYLQVDWVLALVERAQPDVVWRIPTNSRKAALTIDDVPLLKDPTALEAVLTVLRRHGVRATFFVMSGFDLPPEEGGMEPAARQRCKELLRQAVADGHELANHLQFDRPAIAMARDDFDRAFNHCDRFLAGLCGGEAAWKKHEYRWFRPASALWNKHMLESAKKNGYRTVLSNCHPFDVASATRFLNATYLRFRVRPGAVVVVHDRWHTPETLDKAIPAIKAGGIELCTLSELQATADAERSPNRQPSG